MYSYATFFFLCLSVSFSLCLSSFSLHHPRRYARLEVSRRFFVLWFRLYSCICLSIPSAFRLCLLSPSVPFSFFFVLLLCALRFPFCSSNRQCGRALEGYSTYLPTYAAERFSFCPNCAEIGCSGCAKSTYITYVGVDGCIRGLVQQRISKFLLNISFGVGFGFIT